MRGAPIVFPLEAVERKGIGAQNVLPGEEEGGDGESLRRTQGQPSRQVVWLLVHVQHVGPDARQLTGQRRIVVHVEIAAKADRRLLQRVSHCVDALQRLLAATIAPRGRRQHRQVHAQLGNLFGFALVGADHQRLAHHHHTHGLRSSLAAKCEAQVSRPVIIEPGAVMLGCSRICRMSTDGAGTESVSPVNPRRRCGCRSVRALWTAGIVRYGSAPTRREPLSFALLRR